MDTDVLIIGGGLAGLSLAWQLEQQGVDYLLIEARDRFGGRIHSHKSIINHVTTEFDIGPAWFWPGQPLVANMIGQLGLQTFEQYAYGEVIIEDEHGVVQRSRGHASMQGSYRVKGSLNAIVQGIRRHLPDTHYKLDWRATTIKNDNGVLTTSILTNKDEKHAIKSQKIVLALPPRVAAQHIRFLPELSTTIISAMNTIPTWMAGHAKVVAIYEEAFWRDDGLSGDAMSRCGPLIEIHDASPEHSLTKQASVENVSSRNVSSKRSLPNKPSLNNKGPYALFGFMGIPAQARANNHQALVDASLAQFTRLFGDKAKVPVDIVMQDWAQEPETATILDQKPLSHHPEYGLPHPLKKIWDGNIILSSTEVAPNNGGFLEGALEAAASTADQLTR